MSFQSVGLCAGIAALTLGCGDALVDDMYGPTTSCFIERDEAVQDFTATPEGFAFAPNEFVEMAEGTFDGGPIASVEGDVIVGSGTKLEVTVTSMRALVESDAAGPSASTQTAEASRACYGPHYITNLDLTLSTPDGELDEQMSIEVIVQLLTEFTVAGHAEIAGTLRPLGFEDVVWNELAIRYLLSPRQGGGWHIELWWSGESDETGVFTNGIGETVLQPSAEL